MLQWISPEWVGTVSTEPGEHVEAEASVKVIAPQLPSPTHDALESIRIGLCDVASETARNIQRLSQETVEQALEMGQRLWRMQRELKRKEYKVFLGILGWASAKARKFINLAKTFNDFESSRLVGVELTTLLGLCSSRYSSVVAQLREVQDITQQLVEQLIKDNRSPRKQKQDPISGWKQSRSGGGRYYRVELHDEATGFEIEQQAQAENILPQKVIAEAVALRSQHKSSDLVQVSKYRAAQLEELPQVVENARSLERENRKQALEMEKYKCRIAALEAQLAERVAADLAEPDDVENPGVEDKVAKASTKLTKELENQVSAISPEKMVESERETTEASDYLEPESEFSDLEPASYSDNLVEKQEDAQDLGAEHNSVLKEGDLVQISVNRPNGDKTTERQQGIHSKCHCHQQGSCATPRRLSQQTILQG